MGDLEGLAKEYTFSTGGTRRELKASEKRRGTEKVDWGVDLLVEGRMILKRDWR